MTKSKASWVQRLTVASIALTACSASATQLFAQHSAPLPAAWSPPNLTTAGALRRSSPAHALQVIELAEQSDRPPTYRKEGAIIGGAALGLTMLLVSLEFKKYEEGGSVNVPLNTIGGAAIGALLGAFIGGLIEKGPTTSGNAVPTTTNP